MLNCIEDITPGSFRGFNSNHNLNSSPLVWDVDDSIYDYAVYMYGKSKAGGNILPALMVNGSVPFTFTVGGTRTYNANTGAIHAGPTGHGFQAGNSVNFVLKWVMNIKKGEGARVTQLLSCENSGSGDQLNTENGVNSSIVNTTITELGIKDFFTNANIDFHVRVFRWLRDAPINHGDILFAGDITADKAITVDDLFNQSFGWIFQGTTKYDMDLNDSEDTDEYKHISMGNTNSNAANTSSIIDRDDDLAEIQTSHNYGWFNDVENSKRALAIIGSDHDGNPISYKQKLAMSTELAVPVNKIEFLANGSLSGHITLQRNTVFPFEFMPMIPLARKVVSAQDLSTAISLAFAGTHFFGFVVRVMASADALETLQCAINNDFTANYFNHGQYNGASKILPLSRAAKSYLAQCEIGDGTEANYMQFWIGGQEVNDEYMGHFHNLSNDGEYQFFKIEYHDTETINSFDFKTTDTSSVSGVFEVFGVL